MIFEQKLKTAPLILLAMASFVAVASAAKSEESNHVGGGMTHLMDLDGNVMDVISHRKSYDNDEPEIDNELISYEPMMNKIKYPEIESYLSDLLKSGSLETKPKQIVPLKESPRLISMNQKKAPAVPSLPVMEQKEAPTDAQDSAAREDTIKLIAHNSREIRLMGPEEKEVEMKDDSATKMAVALENLKKEAGEVWGQVNTKLDKGWTDFKTMVEDAVESAKNKKANSSKTSTLDDIVNGADETVKTIKDQAEIAGTKIKGFFNNLGVNI